MYLKRLELQGFKSFADKTILEFRKGITSVIGPNGSGKSNISDSIRWVLGEQSMKSLRGAKSQDIIFSGTQNRKSLGFAEASLIFDNSDGILPIEYTEVTITRKIYRTGETGYFINKVPCRLKDVLELFMDTGIGRDGYSIIGQGKIDEILSNKSEDRRHIFEEAAGIVKYRSRKQESEKKLEHTKLNLLRINDILSEIETNIDPLKNQSEKAKKYLGLKEELKNIEVGLFVANIEKYKEELKKVVEDEEIYNAQFKAEENRLQNIQKLKEELKVKIDEITLEIERISNLGFESQKEVEMLNSSISVTETRKTNNIENKKRLEKEILELEGTIKTLEDESKQKELKKENLKENKEKFEKELLEKEKQLLELTAKLSDKEKMIEGYKLTVEENTDKKYELQGQINIQDINYQNDEKRQKHIETEIRVDISDLDSTRLEREEISKKFQQIDDKRKEIISNIEKYNSKKEDVTKNIDKFEKDINVFSMEKRIKDSKLKFLIETEKEKEGYIKSVKDLLKACENTKELGKGMHGILANIIDVPDEYQVAIEMCLGSSLQNIVTESEEDAKRLVEYLRKNNLGRASFLPLSSVKGKKVENLKIKVEGYIGIASDLVTYDKKYQEIVLSLIGRTVIVDNMESAIKFSKLNNYSTRVITLEGDVINPAGSITGGSVAKKSVNILGRGKEIEKLQKEIKSLEEKIERIVTQKEEYEKAIEDIFEEGLAYEKELQEIDIVYAIEKQKVTSIEENIKRLEVKLSKLKIEKENLQKQKEEYSSNKEKYKEEIQELNKTTEDLNSKITEFANLNKDNQKYIDDLNFDITNLKISVSSFDESESSISEIQERINLDIQNSNKSINHKKEQIIVINDENTNFEKEVENIKNQINKIKFDVENSTVKIEELKNQRVDDNKILSLKEEELKSTFMTIEDLKGQVIKVEVKKTKLEEDIHHVISKMWEEYELTPNNIGEFKKPDSIANTQREVNRLRTEIRELGSVNVDAIEEYRQLKDRYDFMCEQRVDLESTMAKLRNMISEITDTMKTQFKTQFEIINKNFNDVFKELFGGGTANLKLIDEQNILECGIDITVQPPGKKLQNMMLLSGGERALTAIALLFGILKINPSPFCVLDEIEAALDDVNVFRYAEYLKKFVGDTQFLVITHRKGTMEAADTVYGVTMEESGISKLLSMKLK